MYSYLTRRGLGSPSLRFEPELAWSSTSSRTDRSPFARDGVVGGGVLADPVVPNLAHRPAGRERPEVAEEVLLVAPDVGLQHVVEPGDELVGAVEAAAGRAGRDVDGVVADLVVVVVLAQLGPEGLQLVLGDSPTRGRGSARLGMIEATAPPRQWPGQRWMSWFWLLAASQFRAELLKSWSYLSIGDGVAKRVPSEPPGMSGHHRGWGTRCWCRRRQQPGFPGGHWHRRERCPDRERCSRRGSPP